MTTARYIVAPGRPADVDRAVAIDDAASALYESAGIVFDLGDDHPFVLDERRDWTASATRGGLFFAVPDEGAREEKVGFIAMSEKDGDAYLDQISVLPDHMRRGIGTMLMDRAFAWSRDNGFAHLWLTTYDHVPWNRAYYARLGFAVVAERDCGPAIRATLAEQRAALPAPGQRIAMKKTL